MVGKSANAMSVAPNALRLRKKWDEKEKRYKNKGPCTSPLSLRTRGADEAEIAVRAISALNCAKKTITIENFFFQISCTDSTHFGAMKQTKNYDKSVGFRQTCSEPVQKGSPKQNKAIKRVQ